MPLTAEGEKVMASMRKQYGDKKAEEVFYASINDKKPGSENWHEKSTNENVTSKKVHRKKKKGGKKSYDKLIKAD